MRLYPSVLASGPQAASARLANALSEAIRATQDVDGDDLHDGSIDLDALEAVAGGAPSASDVYRASAAFLADWRGEADTIH